MAKGNRWKAKDLDNLPARVTYKCASGNNTTPAAVQLKKMMKESRTNTPEKTELSLILNVIAKDQNLHIENEYKFHNERLFRFDWAIPSHKIAIEYEGLFSEKSGHTTITGYVKDTEKYNLAAIDGWRVLRYTAVNYKQIYDDLLKLIVS